ncbi:hypothetical protein GOC19_30550 [Sinorhizobium meliloti]|nr:hypothetical protein [Sinorhizobium meliloti]
MSSFFSADQIDAMSGAVVRCDLLVEMAFRSETIRVWNGNTELTAGGRKWLPMYGYGIVDGLSMPTSAVSESITLQLNGLPNQAADFLKVAIDETPEVDQQTVTVFIQLFNEDWQPFGLPAPIWWGYMQPPRISRTQVRDLEGAVQTITLTAENAFFGRSRPPFGRYTDRDQQNRSPGDRFFQFTASLVYKSFRYPDY